MDCSVKSPTFGNDLYCHSCGMDIKLNHFTKKIKGNTIFFCCEGCANK